MLRGMITALLLLAAITAMAQDYPAKPVVIVVPAAAGGPTDTLTRVLAAAVPPSKATPESLGQMLKSEIEKWTPIIRKSGVYAD